MKLNKLLILSFVVALSLGSCSKKDNFDPAKQAELDEAQIVKFIADNKIAAVRHSSGVYYQIIKGQKREEYPRRHSLHHQEPCRSLISGV